MSFVVTVTTVDEASGEVARISARIADRKSLQRAAAEGVLPLVQGRFRALASSNVNRFGVRGGFWNRMLAGTRASATETTARIAMPREVALRYFGGKVTPKQSKRLAIPASAEAYGKSPREFDDLRFAIIKGVGAALVRREQTQVKFGKRRKDGSRAVSSTPTGGDIMYRLVKSATIRGDRSILPADAALVAAAQRGVLAFVEVQAARGGRSA